MDSRLLADMVGQNAPFEIATASGSRFFVPHRDFINGGQLYAATHFPEHAHLAPRRSQALRVAGSAIAQDIPGSEFRIYAALPRVPPA